MSPGHFHEGKAGLAGWVLRLCLQSATQVLHRTPQLRIVNRGGGDEEFPRNRAAWRGIVKVARYYVGVEMGDRVS